MKRELNEDKVRLLTERDVATLIGFSVFWLQRTRLIGGGPPFIKLGRSVRYPAARLAEWLESQPLHLSTSA
jgi:predicted DNA-binding transcriptional regulator AlpA